MEQDDGFGYWIGGLVEKEDVTIRSQATDDFGTWWGVDGMTQGGDRDFAIIADADASLLTPDIGPPGAARIWA